MAAAAAAVMWMTMCFRGKKRQQSRCWVTGGDSKECECVWGWGLDSKSQELEKTVLKVFFLNFNIQLSEPGGKNGRQMS